MRTSDGAGVPRGQELDWRSVDWQRARRAVYVVQQKYTYAYSAPVTAIRQRLVMVPRERHGDQTLLEQQLTASGADNPVPDLARGRVREPCWATAGWPHR